MKLPQLTKSQRRGVGGVFLLLSIVLAGASATDAFADAAPSCTYTYQADGSVFIAWQDYPPDQSGAPIAVRIYWVYKDSDGNSTWVWLGNIGYGPAGNYTVAAADVPASTYDFAAWMELGDIHCSGTTPTPTTTTQSTTTTEAPTTTTEATTTTTTEATTTTTEATTTTTEAPTTTIGTDGTTTTSEKATTTTTKATTTTEAPTTTKPAPTTTVAPTTTDAPNTTVAPTSTSAPTTTIPDVTTTTTPSSDSPSATIALDCDNLQYVVTFTNPTSSTVKGDVTINGSSNVVNVGASGTKIEQYQLVEDSTYTFTVSVDGTKVDDRTFTVNCDGLAKAEPLGYLSYQCDPTSAKFLAINGKKGSTVPYSFMANGVEIGSGDLLYGAAVEKKLQLTDGKRYELSVIVDGKTLAHAEFDFVCDPTTGTTVPQSSTTKDPGTATTAKAKATTTTAKTKVLGTTSFNSTRPTATKSAGLAYTGSKTLTAIVAALCFMIAGGLFYSTSKLSQHNATRRRL